MGKNVKPNKTKIVVVCGPTATGKSRLAVDIALKHGGEVINADSMQIYRGMDIANATPLESERMGVAHHLFGIIEPEKAFSVAEWLILAREKIAELEKRAVLPIVVGGTGLYISSLVDNIVFDDIGVDYDFRAKMYNLAKQRGNAFLLGKLREIDPDAASQLHENNVKRVIRALEVYERSGRKSAERIEQSRAGCSLYEACMLGIDFTDRNLLYDRINLRVDAMLTNGLEEEARRNAALLETNATSAQAIGHKELLPFIKEEESLETCAANLKMKSRNYAKRQLTWFRKDSRINWLFIDGEFKNDYNLLLEKVLKILNDFAQF
ncbi:MAG: tRNA (adenosine(37)-N6)-dimethylallyltransferase MiaA [Oscillospiraceae bacterium]|nr:tRNA (adenosine(37)-N6)-dimethylallyltransferase MiaA [Oscillospiraceae bacterium]